MLTVLAVVIGVVISLPAGIFAYRHKRAYAPVTWVAGLLYTIPSLALFAFLTSYTGLTTLTAEIGLVSYTLLILIRNVVAGLEAVPADVKEAASGMGYTKRQLLLRVELPLALPLIAAGVRVATVTTIGLVTVTALIGKGGLGYFMLLGLRRFFSTPIVVGAGLSVVLAFLAEASLAWGQRLAAPWIRWRVEPGAAG
ncbi:MAG: ABC transporter permease [Actinomycetota bacterium]|nr:ABC transporter permease [Actinomycetota bacterium]